MCCKCIVYSHCQLEEEVSGLKKRLEDLRKAKNTTILKREREILEVGAPKLGAER